MQLPDRNSLWTTTLYYLEDAAQAGLSRAHTPEMIAKILAVEGLPYQQPDGTYTPYCAAGIAYYAAKSLATLLKIPFNGGNAVQVFKQMIPLLQHTYYRPSASVSLVVEDAQARGIWLPVEEFDGVDLLPGWLVAFRWNDGGHHIGCLVADNDDHIRLVEANTEINGIGGVFAYKDRSFDGVWGCVKTYV